MTASTATDDYLPGQASITLRVPRLVLKPDEVVTETPAAQTPKAPEQQSQPAAPPPAQSAPVAPAAKPQPAAPAVQQGSTERTQAPAKGDNMGANFKTWFGGALGVAAALLVIIVGVRLIRVLFYDWNATPSQVWSAVVGSPTASGYHYGGRPYVPPVIERPVRLGDPGTGVQTVIHPFIGIPRSQQGACDLDADGMLVPTPGGRFNCAHIQ